MVEREKEEFGDEEEGLEGRRIRPLEDPDLVGVEAAERARRERVGRLGNEVLIREDKRWEWLLGEFFFFCFIFVSFFLYFWVSLVVVVLMMFFVLWFECLIFPRRLT